MDSITIHDLKSAIIVEENVHLSCSKGYYRKMIIKDFVIHIYSDNPIRIADNDIYEDKEK